MKNCRGRDCKQKPKAYSDNQTADDQRRIKIPKESTKIGIGDEPESNKNECFCSHSCKRYECISV